MDDRRIQVGYNEDEIRRFLPRDVRQRELFRATYKADFEEAAKDLVVEVAGFSKKFLAISTYSFLELAPTLSACLSTVLFPFVCCFYHCFLS